MIQIILKKSIIVNKDFKAKLNEKQAKLQKKLITILENNNKTHQYKTEIFEKQNHMTKNI